MNGRSFRTFLAFAWFVIALGAPSAPTIVRGFGQAARADRTEAVPAVAAGQYVGLPGPVAGYRRAVRSTDVGAYRQAASTLRRWMSENDPHYPLYHFTGPESWINDPNGPIYHNGRYHLFYQFDPIVPDGRGGWRRSARCWGHAVSDDLIHWSDWPVAVWPDTPHDCGGVYSGNTVVDDEGRLCGLYTGNVSGRDGPRYGILIRSRDGGVTWEKKTVLRPSQRPNANSPVHHDGYLWRDGERWCQLIGGSTGGPNPCGAAWLWTSDDLEQWTLRKNIAPAIRHGSFWELPYLIELGGRHVLMVGTPDNPYWVGTYDKDAMQFTPDHPKPRSMDSRAFYSFNLNLADGRGPGGMARQLMHGWVRVPASPTAGVPYWQGAHSIPRVLSLGKNGKDIVQRPIREIEALRGRHCRCGPLVVEPGEDGYLPGIQGDALEVMVRFGCVRSTASRLGLKLRVATEGARAIRVWYEVETGRFGISGTETEPTGRGPIDASARAAVAPSDTVNGLMSLRVFLDRSIIEAYCGGAALTNIAFSEPSALGLDLFAEGGRAEVHSVEVWHMKSMWPDP